MMRTLFFLAVITAIATTTYFYGPHFFGSDTQTSPSAFAPSAQTSDKDAVSAGLNHIKHASSTQQVMRPAEVKQPKGKAPSALRRKTRSPQSDVKLPDAPAWSAAKVDQPIAKKVELQSPAAVAEKDRNFSDPMKGRWIDELSGHKVKVAFTKGRVKDGCEFDLNQCDDIRKNDDAKLVGVVVKTHRLAETPTRPVDGSLRAGHYARGTPALYID